MRRSLILVLCGVMSLAVLGTGCGGKNGKGGGSGAGGSIHVEGRITLRGGTPFSTPFLDTADGEVYMLDGSNLDKELRALSGMDVSISGRLANTPTPKGQLPTIEVLAYELLPLPGGEQPIVGVLGGASSDDVWLEDEAGKRWRITGELRGVLAGFRGAKVWVVGNTGTTQTSAPDVIEVTGYGMIRPAS